MVARCIHRWGGDSGDHRLHDFPESGNSYKLALMLTSVAGHRTGLDGLLGGATRTPEWGGRRSMDGRNSVLEEDGVRLRKQHRYCWSWPNAMPIWRRQRQREVRDCDGCSCRIKSSRTHGDRRYQRTFTLKPDPHVLAYFAVRLDDFLSILYEHL